MLTLTNIIALVITSMIANNVILSQFLGICSFLGVSSNKKNSLGMGFAVTFVMVMSGMIAYLINKFLLEKFELVYMRTIVYILIIASLVQIVEILIKRFSKSLYKALGVYLPLITTNCAILGVATIISSLLWYEALIVSFGSGLGYTFVILIFSSMREHISFSDIPNAFKGIPIALILAGIMAMIFTKFGG